MKVLSREDVTTNFGAKKDIRSSPEYYLVLKHSGWNKAVGTDTDGKYISAHLLLLLFVL